MVVNKIQPVSAGLFPSLPARKGFSFTNCLKDWEGNLPDHLLREGLVQKKPNQGQAGQEVMNFSFGWFMELYKHFIFSFLHPLLPFTSMLGFQFLLFQSEHPLFPIWDMNFH